MTTDREYDCLQAVNDSKRSLIWRQIAANRRFP
jgi:hypothetical protein